MTIFASCTCPMGPPSAGEVRARAGPSGAGSSARIGRAVHIVSAWSLRAAIRGSTLAGSSIRQPSEFTRPGAPELDFVFTLCDSAANEPCPVFPGQPVSAHWGLPDPAAATGNEALRRTAFADAYRMISNRVSIFANLPMASLDKLSLKTHLEEIGQAQPPEAKESA